MSTSFISLQLDYHPGPTIPIHECYLIPVNISAKLDLYQRFFTRALQTLTLSLGARCSRQVRTLWSLITALMNWLTYEHLILHGPKKWTCWEDVEKVCN